MPDAGRFAADGGEPDARVDRPDARADAEVPVDARVPEPEPPMQSPEAGPASMRPESSDAAMPEAGPAPDSGMTVRGKLIDFWRQPVAGVEVSIGDSTSRTDAAGAFTIERVMPPYDASIVFSVTYTSENTREYRWLYRGLTRADPTLQVDSNTSARNARVEASFTGVTFPLASTQRFQYVFGSPLTMWNREPDVASWVEGHVWEGAVATSGTAHALLWTVDATLNALPVRFDADGSLPLELMDGARLMPVIELEARTIETGVVAGRVTAGSLNMSRRNHVFVRWPDNARVKIVTDPSGPNDFSYLVPVLENTTIMVAASAGDYSPGPFAVAHRALLPPDQTNVELTIPNPPTIIAPASNETGVNAETLFEWRGEPIVHVLVVDNGTNAALRVVTTERSARLPRGPTGRLTLDPSRMYAAWVETHGRYASVDDAADPAGFLDDYAYNIPGPRELGEPFGPPRPNGSYTASASRRFTLAP